MQIKQKEQVTVSENNSFVIKQKNEANHPFKATLRWKTAVDLDLYCMYKMKDGSTVKGKGLLGKIAGFFGADEDTSAAGSMGTVNYSNKGSVHSKPYIKLDQDSGVGDTGGDNEENMMFHDIDKIEYAIIVANIFNKRTNFAQYNGSVIVTGENTEFTVPLSAKQTGSWCVVAKIDNSGDSTVLSNVNKTMGSKPSLRDFI